MSILVHRCSRIYLSDIQIVENGISKLSPFPFHLSHTLYQYQTYSFFEEQDNPSESGLDLDLGVHKFTHRLARRGIKSSILVDSTLIFCPQRRELFCRDWPEFDRFYENHPHVCLVLYFPHSPHPALSPIFPLLTAHSPLQSPLHLWILPHVSPRCLSFSFPHHRVSLFRRVFAFERRERFSINFENLSQNFILSILDSFVWMDFHVFGMNESKISFQFKNFRFCGLRFFWNICLLFESFDIFQVKFKFAKCE